VGVLDDEEKSDYTLVLKGMIDLSMAKFPAGTRGSNLDILARAPLYGEGKMYYHGTGHGIGHSLCVHEGPQSIRMEENPVPLVPGMVISNEPAVYVAGKYGIRIENAMAVENCTHTVFNDFYSFKTFTRVPICTSCIKDGILSESERIWLNTFNKSVFRDLKPLLDEETSEWLEKYTSDI
jgi:Xaa-Pro aminopeptidase